MKNDKINYLEINKQSWNSKVDLHFKSDFYDTTGFIKRKISLNDIELKLLEEFDYSPVAIKK